MQITNAEIDRHVSKFLTDIDQRDYDEGETLIRLKHFPRVMNLLIDHCDDHTNIDHYVRLLESLNIQAEESINVTVCALSLIHI